ncbi:MAG: PIN domain-containing protein [Candidatus Hydrogenedentes bacterium]|nr:PIN domain-containing protein [Candidatus Hydrogenedentota bacterium]
MADLLDANVWIPLSAPSHVHRSRARKYWEGEAEGDLLFCRITSLALLRYLTSQRIHGSDALTGKEAWKILSGWLTKPAVSFIDEPLGIDEWLGRWSDDRAIRGAAWTDAYLAAFAAAGGYRLVTFDSDFRNYPEVQTLYLGDKA